MPKNSKNLIQSPSDVSFPGSQQMPAAIKQGFVNSGSTELIQIGNASCLPFKFHRVQIWDKQFSVDYKPQHSLQITHSCFTHSLLSALPQRHFCVQSLFSRPVLGLALDGRAAPKRRKASVPSSTHQGCLYGPPSEQSAKDRVNWGFRHFK